MITTIVPTRRVSPSASEVFCSQCNDSIGTMLNSEIVVTAVRLQDKGGLLCPPCRSCRCIMCHYPLRVDRKCLAVCAVCSLLETDSIDGYYDTYADKIYFRGCPCDRCQEVMSERADLVASCLVLQNSTENTNSDY